ncbi:putative Membrane protein [Pseudomonas savastanoi pv. glycinea]|uniref:Membrane protein n=4 Tax=Pseudomonas savastanoi TaxID=29438 RepID=A0ABD4BHU1_PSESH|nr:putative Membrane protein [Pseudomonas savastanoi pv. phaseolicola]RMM61819.1 putative Membrane protein [Pseudomonas savastanoi pv. glycinea]RMO07643.1 putative Membrane protein [Pseudomonas savastanoi pv. phaseolicola]RMQ46497.1 putative Membrane protein [Pseudomonas savastanoi pv. phaseolicola]RMQ54186.1 putative Membrane protein [Pseudomonas savastanoi pv. glycinea]
MMHREHSTAQGQRYYTLVAACLGWSGLVIQLYLIFIGRYADHASLLGGLVRFLSFFTVLSNTLAAVALSCALTARQSAGHRFFRHPVVCGGIAVSIALVGIAYNILLRHLWHPQGWQWVADELLHDIMPLAFVLYWWLYVPKGALRLRHVPLWAIYPVIYFAYVLLRGHMLGDYLYPFIDVGTIGFPKAFINALGVLLGFLLVALLLLGVDRWAARRTM